MANEWIVKIGKKDYPAASLDVVREWFTLGRIPSEATIFNPDQQQWLAAQQFFDWLTGGVIVSTTFTLDGFRITRYLGIVSAEIVLGTGIFTEFRGAFADFFGQRSTAFEKKLRDAKEAALIKLKYAAMQAGGNAVIGVDLDYSEFAGNIVVLVANGTSVQAEPAA